MPIWRMVSINVCEVVFSQMFYKMLTNRNTAFKSIGKDHCKNIKS